MVKMEKSWNQTKEREDEMVGGFQGPRSLAGRDVTNLGGKYWIGERSKDSVGDMIHLWCLQNLRRALNVFAKRVWKRSQGWIRTVGVTGTQLLSAAMAMISHGGETRQESRISSGMQQTFKRPGPACETDSDPEQARPAAVNVQESKQSHLMIPDHISLASGCQPQSCLASKEAVSKAEKSSHWMEVFLVRGRRVHWVDRKIKMQVSCGSPGRKGKALEINFHVWVLPPLQ